MPDLCDATRDSGLNTAWGTAFWSSQPAVASNFMPLGARSGVRIQDMNRSQARGPWMADSGGRHRPG